MTKAIIDATLARSASFPNGKKPANNAVKIPNPHCLMLLGTFIFINFS